MSELLEIIISAIDEASSVFDGIGQSAQESGSSLQTAFEEATAEVERLEQELADIEMGNIEGDFEAVSAQLADAQAQADALEQEFREADEAATQMGDDLGIINSSMLLQLGEQVGQLGSQAEDMAQDMNTAAISVGQLATQTGIAEPEMVNLINTISNATFPNDEAMMYVKSLDQIGVSSSNLGKSATDLDRINDAFGLGAQTTNSLGQELSVLGVDMNNVSSSFNALAYANANTVGGMNNYYNFLRRYDSQFKELGLNVDQASIIIAGATQKFGGGRAALTGLNDALKESNGDTRALEQALGFAAGSLDNASQITGQYEGQLQDLANEEAEHKTILDQIGAAWEDVSLSISQVASPLMGIVGVFGQIGQFGLQVSGIKTLVSTMRELNIVQGITSALEEQGAIARMASALGITAEAGAADGAAVSFGGLAIAEGAALWPILLIAAAIAALIAVVYEVGKAFGWWTDVGSMIDAIWAGIQRLWSAFINHPDVQAAIEMISGALSTLWSWITQAGQAILSFFGVANSGEFDIVRALIDAVGAAWNAVTYPIRIVIGVVQQVIGAFNQFRTGQMDLPAFIMSVLQILANTYMQIFGQIIGRVVSFGSRMVAQGISAATRFVNGIINWIRQLPGRVYSGLIAVVSRISSAIAHWASTASSKVQSVISNITGPFNGVVNTISSALSGVVNAIKAPFESAWNAVKPIVDKISAGINAVKDALGWISGGAGGFELEDENNNNNNVNVNAAGYTLNIEESPVKVEYDINLNLDLINVPTHINTRDLINALKDKTVITSLTGNKDFQDADLKVKSRINSRISRQRGV